MSACTRSLLHTRRQLTSATRLHTCRTPAARPAGIRLLSEKKLAGEGRVNPSKSPYKHGAHRSNAEQLVAEYPVTEVDGSVALCDGGGGALGHPLEYIQLHTVGKPIVECKYCGLRYKQKKKH